MGPMLLWQHLAALAEQWAIPYQLLFHILGLNFMLVCNFPQHVAFRSLFLVVSSALVLWLVPSVLPPTARCLTAQMSGAMFAVVMRLVEYCILEDPNPQPRTTVNYLLTTFGETFKPFDGQGSASRASGGAPASKPATSPPVIQRRHLAPPGTSPWMARLRLMGEIVVQYVIYDIVLAVLVKGTQPGAAAQLMMDADMSQAPAPPPLWSFSSIVQSLGFATVLYLHFAISYKIVVLALTPALPELPMQLYHQFESPWKSATVGELWVRWHQLFRASFIRLAYRPTKAWVRSMLGRAPPASPPLKPGAADKDGTSQAHGGIGNNSNGTAPANGVVAAQGKRNKGCGALARLLEQGLPVMSVFVLSGVVHEYMCWASFGGARGYQMAFFLLHGAMAVLEGALQHGAPGLWRSAAWCGLWRVLVLGFGAITSVLFMRPWVDAGYHHDFWHPWSVLEVLPQAAAFITRPLAGQA